MLYVWRRIIASAAESQTEHRKPEGKFVLFGTACKVVLCLLFFAYGQLKVARRLWLLFFTEACFFIFIYFFN